MKEKISYTCAKMLTPLIEKVLNCTDPIPVYREHMRIKETFQLSIQALEKSHNLLIFPEKKGNQLENFKHVFQFNTGFIYLARQYFKETKKVLHFVPVSINPNVRTIAVGTAIQYDPSNAYDEEKHRLCHYLMEQIEKLFEPSLNH